LPDLEITLTSEVLICFISGPEVFPYCEIQLTDFLGIPRNKLPMPILRRLSMGVFQEYQFLRISLFDAKSYFSKQCECRTNLQFVSKQCGCAVGMVTILYL